VRLSKWVVVLFGVLVSGVALAEGDAAAASSSNGLVAIGSALAMGLAAIGASGGQGRTAGSALEGIARNPGSRPAVFGALLLSLAFIELSALLGFVIGFLWWLK
jgi:F-type H+-transporting ATPase subunit c